MHELTICLNIMRSIEKQAYTQNIHCVNKVWLEIGELTGIEIEAIRFSFPIAASKTIAAKAELVIATIPGLAFCRNCKTEITVATLFSACCHCHGYDYEIIHGKELRIIKMEVN